MSHASLLKPDYLAIRIGGFTPSWAGADPFGDGFCIGSEDGRILFTDENGKHPTAPSRIAGSGEAINGVAGLPGYLAASTRQEIVVFDRSASALETIAFGSHGIMATSNSNFVAPLGHRGIMTVTPSAGVENCWIVEAEANIYALREMPPSDGRPMSIGACRARGVGMFLVEQQDQRIEFGSCVFPEIDIVDVVSAGTVECPYAAVAVGLKGEIVLFRDVTKREAPAFLKYKQFVGTTYRVLTACGHIFVLTSKALYVISDLAARLAQSSFGEHNIPVMTLPMEASDANICGNRWLLTVMEDEVHRYDVHQIHDLMSEFPASQLDFASHLPHSNASAGGWLPSNSIQQVVTLV